tara:strand:- start:24771 stop:25052 length:282 start_codon:yes stop_codon:yes gene_type:complete
MCAPPHTPTLRFEGHVIVTGAGEKSAGHIVTVSKQHKKIVKYTMLMLFFVDCSMRYTVYPIAGINKTHGTPHGMVVIRVNEYTAVAKNATATT